MKNVSFYRPNSRILSSVESVALTAWVSEALEEGAENLLIDFRDVLFMDSRGLGALIIANNRAKKASATLGLCCLNGQARMLFEMSNTHTVFNIYDSVEDFQRDGLPYPNVA
ncbi:MAG: STAS domain-containing protein [Elainellaceae cyanobacterium]